MSGYNQPPIFEIFKLKVRRRHQQADVNAPEFELRIKYSSTRVLQICSQYSICKIVYHQNYAMLTAEKIEEIKTTFDESVHYLEDWKLISELVEKESVV
jgi:hypothetical protein